MGLIKVEPLVLLFVLHYCAKLGEVVGEVKLKDLDNMFPNVEETVEVTGNSTNGTHQRAVTVFVDNIHKSYPVFDLMPLTSIMRGVGEQYKTIILDCLPIVQNFPPEYDGNIYFHLPQAVAELNKKELGESPLNIWLHPHLHIPYLNLDLKYQKFLSTKPMDIALYMVNKANSVYPETVSGVLITAAPLIIKKYRNDIPSFKRRVVWNDLKFGIIIESYHICESLPDKIPELKNLLSNFDQFYFHQPTVLKEDDKTGNAMEDAILEGRAFYAFFESCKERLKQYIPEGINIKPIRGYLRAKFTENELMGRMKFKFDVIRF